MRLEKTPQRSRTATRQPGPYYQYRSGFTIVELLIVIVAVGILAAISIIAYSGIQARAAMSKKETTIANIHKQLELHRVENDRYPNTHDEYSYTYSLDDLVDSGIDVGDIEAWSMPK